MRVLGLAIAAFLIGAAPANAAVFTVTTNQDTFPSQVPCTALSCSLRSAVEAAVANGNGPPDQIVVPAATYTLTQGALSVGSSATGITIAGAGATTTTITAGGASQVLTLGGETSVSVTGVTLAGGTSSDGPGGNVSVGNTATLALDHVRVTGGTATSGAGISAVSSAVLAINASTIDHNTATGSLDPDGGGGS